MEQRLSNERKMPTFGDSEAIKMYFKAIKIFQARSGKIYELVDLLQRHTFPGPQLFFSCRGRKMCLISSG